MGSGAAQGWRAGFETCKISSLSLYLLNFIATKYCQPEVFRKAEWQEPAG